MILWALLGTLSLTTVVGRLIDNKDYCFQENTVYNHGHVLAEKTTPTVWECQRWCKLFLACTHFSFYHTSQMCYLRQGNKAQYKAGTTSGPKYCVKETISTQPNCTESICLKGGNRLHEGDVFVEGLPVCDDSWGLREGYVACKQLGYPGVSRVTVESDYGTEAKNYSLDDVHCLGNETSLQDCHHKKVNNCGKSEAAGVVCTYLDVQLPDNCYEPKQLCLSNGPDRQSGNLYYGGKPVCHNGFDLLDAFVACRSMGFLGVKNFTANSKFGLGNTYFAMSGLSCLGHEKNLDECLHTTDGAGCTEFTVAGVICSQQAEEVQVSSIHVPVLISLAVVLVVAAVLIIAFVKFRSNKLKKLKNVDKATSILKFKNPMLSETVES